MSQITQPRQSNALLLLLFWLYVGIPLAWGVVSTLKQALALFQ